MALVDRVPLMLATVIKAHSIERVQSASRTRSAGSSRRPKEDGLCEQVDLLAGEEVSLRRLLLRESDALGGVIENAPVPDCGFEDPCQEPVRPFDDGE